MISDIFDDLVCDDSDEIEEDMVEIDEDVLDLMREFDHKFYNESLTTWEQSKRQVSERLMSMSIHEQSDYVWSHSRIINSYRWFVLDDGDERCFVDFNPGMMRGLGELFCCLADKWEKKNDQMDSM